MEVDRLQPILNIETRTGFFDPREGSMADNLGFGIVGAEALEEFYHGLLLGWSACVGRIAVGIKTALVANADAVGVVMLGMSTGHLLWAAWVDGAVLGDVVVVADGAEASGLMAGFKVFDREVAVGSGSRAMNYNQIDFSHDFLWILMINKLFWHTDLTDHTEKGFLCIIHC